MSTAATQSVPLPRAPVAPLKWSLVTDAAFALDVGSLALVSVAIAVASTRLAFMSVLVPAVVLLRTAIWSHLRAADGHRRGARELLAELLLLTVCTALGGFNDWNSVVRHEIYDYTVPHYFPGFSSIRL